MSIKKALPNKAYIFFPHELQRLVNTLLELPCLLSDHIKLTAQLLFGHAIIFLFYLTQNCKYPFKKKKIAKYRQKNIYI